MVDLDDIQDCEFVGLAAAAAEHVVEAGVAILICFLEGLGE